LLNLTKLSQCWGEPVFMAGHCSERSFRSCDHQRKTEAVRDIT